MSMNEDYDYGDFDPYASYDPNQWAMQQYLMPGGGGGYTPAPGYAMPQIGNPMGMQPQMDPLMYQQVMSMLQPSLTSKGALEPYDIDYQGKIRNGMQDTFSSFDDPIWTLISGLGSTSPEAFDPITERTPMETSAANELSIRAQMGGLEGTIAEMILAGQSPLSAAAAVRAAVEHPDEVQGGLDEATINSIRAQIPRSPGQMGQGDVDDWNAVTKIAQDLASPYIAEQAKLSQPGIEYDEQGRAYTTSEKPSALMEFLQKTGIPDPRQQYGPEYAAQQDPMGFAQLMDRFTGTESRLKDAKKAFQTFLSEDDKRKRNLAQDQRQLDRYGNQATVAAEQPEMVWNPISFNTQGGMTGGNMRYPPTEASSAPGKPRLSRYSEARPSSGLIGDAVQDAMMRAVGRKPPERGMIPAQTGTREGKAKDIERSRKDYTDANFQLAMALAPQLALRRAGRTPIGDALQQRMQPFYAAGAAGQPGMPWQYPRPPGG